MSGFKKWEDLIYELGFIFGLENVITGKVEVFKPESNMLFEDHIDTDHRHTDRGAKIRVVAGDMETWTRYQKYMKIFTISLLLIVKETDIARQIANGLNEAVDNRDAVAIIANVNGEFCQESGFAVFHFIKDVTHVSQMEGEGFDQYLARFEVARENLLRRRKPIDDDLLLCFFSTGLRSDTHRAKLNDILSDEKARKWKYTMVVRKLRNWVSNTRLMDENKVKYGSGTKGASRGESGSASGVNRPTSDRQSGYFRSGSGDGSKKLLQVTKGQGKQCWNCNSSDHMQHECNVQCSRHKHAQGSNAHTGKDCRLFHEKIGRISLLCQGYEGSGNMTMMLNGPDPDFDEEGKTSLAVFDTGATDWFLSSNHRRLVSKNGRNHAAAPVRAANGSVMRSSIGGRFKRDERVKVEVLDQLEFSVISGGRVADLGKWFIGNSKRVLVVNSDEAVTKELENMIKDWEKRGLIYMRANRCPNGLYLSNLDDINPGNHKSVATIRSMQSVTFYNIQELVHHYHRILGHMSQHNMIELVKHQSLEGIHSELTTSAINKYYPKECVDCVMGGLRRRGISSNLSGNRVVPEFIGDEIEVDVLYNRTGNGITTEGGTFSGCKYAVISVDRTSRYMHGFLIKNMDNILDTIKEVRESYNSDQKSIKRIRMDSQFDIKEITNYLRQHGIEYEIVPPGEHSLLGTVERANGLIANKMIKLMQHPDIGEKKLWGYALLHAIFLWNITPRQYLNSKTPYECWKGKKFDMNKHPLMAFGTTVYAHVKVEDQRTMDNRAVKTTYVGCAINHVECVQLYNPNSKRIIHRRSFKAILNHGSGVINHESDIDNEEILPANRTPYDATMGVSPTNTPGSESTSQDIDNDIEVIEPVDIINDQEGPTEEVVQSVVENNNADRGWTSIEHKKIKNNQNKRKAVTVGIAPSSNGPTPGGDSPQVQGHANRSQGNSDKTNEKVARNGRHSRPMRPEVTSHNPYEKTYHHRYLSLLMQVHENLTFDPKSHQRYKDVKIPKNPKKARDPANKYHSEWDAATKSELESLKEQGTFEYIDYVPPKEKTIQSMLKYDIRFDPMGLVKKFKARLVGLGNEQTTDTYSNTYADTLSTRSFNILLSIAAKEGLHLESIDVKTAFLYSYLKEEIYLKRPFGLTSTDMPEYVRLRKCLYGLKQAAFEWRSHVNITLVEMGFKRCISDECVYVLRKEDGNYIIVGVYVDDILVAGSTSECLEWFNIEIAKIYSITINKPLDSYLGMNIIRDWKNKSITINQPGYIDKIVNKFGFGSDVDVGTLPETPMKVISKYVEDYKDDSMDLLLDETGKKLYMEKIGSIMHATVHTRPDLSFCTSMVAQKLVSPNRRDMELANRILMYLRNTREQGLTFSGTGGVKLSMTVDASYAEHPDRKSHYGITLCRVGDWQEVCVCVKRTTNVYE